MSRYISDGRDDDLRELCELRDRESNPDVRRSISSTIQAVRNEDRMVRSMREALVRAHRNKDKGEIQDIHDYIKGKQQYGR